MDQQQKSGIRDEVEELLSIRDATDRSVSTVIESVCRLQMDMGVRPRRILLGKRWMWVLAGARDHQREIEMPLYPQPSGYTIDTCAGWLPLYFVAETDWLIAVDEIETPRGMEKSGE